MASTITRWLRTKMKKIKAKMSTTHKPHKKDYVELFPEYEEIKIGIGKIFTAQLIEILSD